MSDTTHKPGYTLAPSVILSWALTACAAIFFALHFLHLNADFPTGTAWMDWSKYTDEGWYGDAAIRQVLFGHWYWKGDFNPAVALPAWPTLEYLVFRFTGVSAVAARAFTLCIFLVTLVAAWLLLERHSPPRATGPSRSLAAPLAVLFLATNPFLYVFERMAILEPLLISLTLLALLAASYLHPLGKPDSASGPQSTRPLATLRRWIPTAALGLLLPAMVLTKTTAVFLVPSVAYMAWARAGYRFRAALRFSIVPTVMAMASWLSYYLLFAHRYAEDYKYLFTANAYNGSEMETFARVILNTVADGMWMGKVLYPSVFITMALAVFWYPRLFRNPVVPSLILWAGGYLAFIGYHYNLQPRYYIVSAVPITLLVAIGLDCFRITGGRAATVVASSLVAIAVAAIVIPDALQTLSFIRTPEYTFRAAAEGVASVVRADKTHPNLLLSISGSDITLMTGLPSIDDDFGTLELPDRVKAYRPGWYAAWNELDDDKMDALTPLYHIERVASFPAYDDPDRNLLILYRLDPTIVTPPPQRRKRRTPKPLVTKLGQQPTTQQLEH